MAIKRGENQGKTITYHNVARRWIKLDAWNGKAAHLDGAGARLCGDGIDGAAVMVQKRHGGKAERHARRRLCVAALTPMRARRISAEYVAHRAKKGRLAPAFKLLAVTSCTRYAYSN